VAICSALSSHSAMDRAGSTHAGRGEARRCRVGNENPSDLAHYTRTDSRRDRFPSNTTSHLLNTFQPSVLLDFVFVSLLLERIPKTAYRCVLVGKSSIRFKPQGKPTRKDRPRLCRGFSCPSAPSSLILPWVRLTGSPTSERGDLPMEPSAKQRIERLARSESVRTLLPGNDEEEERGGG
jgi:hypothetical protein